MEIILLIFYGLLDLTWLLFLGLTFVYSYRNWKESRININLYLMVLAVILIFYVFNSPSSSFLNFIVGETLALNPYIHLTIGNSLTVGYIISNIVILSAFQFFVYLKDWKTLYTLPIISGMILITSLYLSTIDIIIHIFGIIIALLFLIDAIKTRNGIEIGISFIIWFTISCFPTTNLIQETLFVIIRTTSMVFVFLGISGFFDEWIFYDKEQKEKIENTWITKRVVIQDE